MLAGPLRHNSQFLQLLQHKRPFCSIIALQIDEGRKNGPLSILAFNPIVSAIEFEDHAIHLILPLAPVLQSHHAHPLLKQRAIPRSCNPLLPDNLNPLAKLSYQFVSVHAYLYPHGGKLSRGKSGQGGKIKAVFNAFFRRKRRLVLGGEPKLPDFEGRF